MLNELSIQHSTFLVSLLAEQPPNQRGHGGLHAQDPRPETHGAESDAFERLDLLGDEPALGADGERHRLPHVAGAWLRRAGMCDECESAAGPELVLDKRAKESAQL